MKVAIVGSCPSSRWLAPFGDPSWKIWACGIEDSAIGIVSSLGRIDDFFEFHGNMHWPENRQNDFRYLDWLRCQPFTVWMQDKSYLPHAKVFPKDACLERFGPYFFTSSVPWMMAKAMLDGATDIALYGVDLATTEERRSARPAVQHFIWLAEQQGIRVSSPKESDILSPPPLYGYVESSPRGRKLAARTRELKDNIAAMETEARDLAANIERLKGALEDNEYHEAIWTGEGVPEPIEKANVVTLTAKG